MAINNASRCLQLALLGAVMAGRVTHVAVAAEPAAAGSRVLELFVEACAPVKSGVGPCTSFNEQVMAPILAGKGPPKFDLDAAIANVLTNRIYDVYPGAREYLQQNGETALQRLSDRVRDSVGAAVGTIGNSNLLDLEKMVLKERSDLALSVEELNELIQHDPAPSEEAVEKWREAMFNRSIYVEAVERLAIPAHRFLSIHPAPDSQIVQSVTKLAKSLTDPDVSEEVKLLVMKIGSFESASWRDQLWTFVRERLGDEADSFWFGCLGMPSDGD